MIKKLKHTDVITGIDHNVLETRLIVDKINEIIDWLDLS